MDLHLAQYVSTPHTPVRSRQWLHLLLPHLHGLLCLVFAATSDEGFRHTVFTGVAGSRTCCQLVIQLLHQGSRKPIILQSLLTKPAQVALSDLVLEHVRGYRCCITDILVGHQNSYALG